MLHFLHRHDPQPDVFEAYAGTVQALATSGAAIAAILRQFEMALLRHSGYALNLDCEAASSRDLEPLQNYDYRVEQGAVPVSRDEGPMVFTGETLAAIAAQQFDDPAILRAANRLMREVVAYHLGGKELKSRKVLLEMRRK